MVVIKFVNGESMEIPEGVEVFQRAGALFCRDAFGLILLTCHLNEVESAEVVPESVLGSPDRADVPALQV